MGLIHIVTPEYPPTLGGVADYARHIAEALAAAGEDVHIWCPAGGQRPTGGGLHVHGTFEGFNRSDFARTDRELDGFPAPRRLFVQWVPHGYGRHSMNLSFCLWLRRRARQGDTVELMVHEPFLTFWEGTWRQTLVAAVHRVMTTVLLQAASRVWISIPAWERMWKPFALGRRVPFSWLPITSGLARPAEQDVCALRASLTAGRRPLVGHLGTYGRNVTSMLDVLVPEILRSSPDADVMLLGAGSNEYRSTLVQRDRALEGRLLAAGRLDEPALALHVAACDVLVQPYPDGISSRRTTAMAALRIGVPLVATRGYLTEPFWSETRVVRMHDVRRLADMANDVRDLLCDGDARARLAVAGRDLYARMFDVNLVVNALTQSKAGKAA
ncbi:MAG: glycosyltransferase [Acidobacteria bacterium]|nr:MAG: glycosyltransferase [Acidobacteriota bacterium]